MTPEERAQAIVNNLPLAGGHSFVPTSEQYLLTEIARAIAGERERCASEIRGLIVTGTSQLGYLKGAWMDYLAAGLRAGRVLDSGDAPAPGPSGETRALPEPDPGSGGLAR